MYAQSTRIELRSVNTMTVSLLNLAYFDRKYIQFYTTVCHYTGCANSCKHAVIGFSFVKQGQIINRAFVCNLDV